MSYQNIILLLSSGIFLGLTIFTKVPAITLIPLVGFIVFTNNKKSFKALGLWIIPVILIPLMWPAHAVMGGEFDQWQDGIIYQTTRASKPLFDAVNDFYNKDPVLLFLGIAGFVFATIVRKDLLFVFWIVPFLGFFYVVDYVSHFHMIPLIPAFCIGAGGSDRRFIRKGNEEQKIGSQNTALCDNFRHRHFWSSEHNSPNC